MQIRGARQRDSLLPGHATSLHDSCLVRLNLTGVVSTGMPKVS